MCPLCRVAHKSDREYIWHFFDEGADQGESIDAVRRARGFCDEHIEMLRRIEIEGMNSTLAISTMFADTFPGIVEDLDSLTPDAHFRRAPCPACANRDERLHANAQYLLDELATSPGHRETFEASPGLCFRPSTTDFTAAEQGPLLDAVRRLGGIERWAGEFGLPYVPRISRGVGTRRETSLWDDARIEAAISPLIEELGRWPTKGEFRGAGLSKALAAVYTQGGSAVWQQRFGVEPRAFEGPVPDRRRGIRSSWRPGYATSVTDVRPGRRSRSSRPLAITGSTRLPQGTEESTTGKSAWRSRRVLSA